MPLGVVTMLDIEEARRILGVNADASKNDIEKRYWVLLKKSKAEKNAKSGDSASNPETIDIDRATKAYNILMGYEVPESETTDELGTVKGKSIIDRKKAGNFFYYYKVHIILGAILILFLSITLRSCMTKVEPDFNLAFMGKINYTDTNDLKKAIQSNIPEIKEPGFDGAYVTLDEKSPTDETMMIQKAMVIMMASETDVYILDKDLFEIYAEDGFFEPLDADAEDLGFGVESQQALYAKVEGDTEEKLYGIDVTNSSILEETGIAGKTLIAAISVNSRYKEKALDMVRLLINIDVEIKK